MARPPIPTWFFALVVVRWRGRFLLVQEAKHGQLWYLPAGRAEPGESLTAAAMRETLEEAGVAIRLTGILAIEHTPHRESARVRVVFLAEPLSEVTPKTTPDEHSLRAMWVSLEEVHGLQLRGEEVRQYLHRANDPSALAPLGILRREGE
jgi:8-oxo-dGTP pyrophosphatase MutT (NUDIX family)